MSRIFISHSSANNAAALALAYWLETQGWSDYFLDIDENRGIAPGERWMAELAGAVDRCEAVIFLVSPAWRDSKYCFAEFYQAKNFGKRIFGVIVEPIPLSQLPEQMTAEWQVCDLTHSSDPVSFTVARVPTVPQTVVRFPRTELDRLARGLRKAGLDPANFVWPPDDDRGRSPYPGLRALEERDAAVFFGRDAPIVRAIDQIRLVRERGVEHLFVILGASGAGKSSFLRAGLLPRLRRDAEHFVVVPPIRPKNAVISGTEGLLSSLKGALAAAGRSRSYDQIRGELADLGLASMLRRIEPPLQRRAGAQPAAIRTVVIPVDQAEELFATDGQKEAEEFLRHVDTLHRQGLAREPVPTEERLRVLFVMTIRSDSLPRMQVHAALQALSPVLFSLPAMPVSEYRAVIEGPARRHTEAVKPLLIAPQLTEQLVTDAQGADALPLLALTLEWLYCEFTTAEGTRIGHDEYQRLGGVRGVIGKAVERAFERPGSEPVIPAQRDEQERLLRQVFPHVATVDPDTGEWKRRVALREVLQKAAAQADALVARLIEQRLLLTDSRSMAVASVPVEVVEVAHEALLRQWETLERWLREFAADLSATESIRRAANEWHRTPRDDTLLVHTGHRLQAAEALVSDERLRGRFEPVDSEYVAACRRRDRRELQAREDQLQRVSEQQAARAKLQRRATWGLSTATLVVLGLLVWIVMQTRSVARQTSLVLTAAGERADDESRFDRGLRLGVLAAKESWLSPAHPNAAPQLARAAQGSLLRFSLTGLIGAGFSPDGKRVITASGDTTIQVWDVDAGKPAGAALIHEGKVGYASFSPDGRRVITVSAEAVRIWDVETGKPVGAALIHEGKVDSASFSPDGKRVVTASWYQTARVWDVDTGKPVGTALKHDGPVLSATFSLDGKRVVTASWDETARVWDAETGKPVGTALKHDDAVLSASFSPDGKRVVTASLDQTARVWDAETGKPVGTALKHDGFVYSASFSPDSKLVVTASHDGTARVWDATTGKPVGTVLKHDGPVWFISFSFENQRLVIGGTGIVQSASFSPDGKWVITASGGMVRVWDVGTGEPVGTALKHDEPVLSVRFSPDGKRVLTASRDKTAWVWDADIGMAADRQLDHYRGLQSVSFSADGKRAVTTQRDKTARVWDSETGKPVGAALEHDAEVEFARFSADGKRVITASGDRTVQVWDVEDSKPVGAALKYDADVEFPRFSTDGKRSVTVSGKKTVQVWDVDTGKPVGRALKHDDDVKYASFSPDGKRVFTMSGGAVRIWDVDTGERVGAALKHDDDVDSTSFSPDGKRIVTTSGEKTVQVWDVETGKPVGAVLKHDEPVLSASFSPDGKRVVTASRDQTARVWDAETGKPVSTALKHDGIVDSASFSPDGKLVVTAARDGTTRVWDAATGKPVGEALKEEEGPPMVRSASFSPDGKRVVITSTDKTPRIRDAAWSSMARSPDLVREVCDKKLIGFARTLTQADIAFAPILAGRVGEDVCTGNVSPDSTVPR